VVIRGTEKLLSSGWVADLGARADGADPVAREPHHQNGGAAEGGERARGKERQAESDRLRPGHDDAAVPQQELQEVGLAGGQGVRARPLTLKAPGYLRSKAAMSFLGRRLIRWVIQILSSEGVKDYYIIAHGKENRYQIKVMIGYGEGFGVDVKYSPVKYDALSTGSADSALRMIEYWDITQSALVFPTDTIIDFDLEPMLRAHEESGAIATIAAMLREPDEVAEKYGAILADGDPPDAAALEVGAELSSIHHVPRTGRPAAS